MNKKKKVTGFQIPNIFRDNAATVAYEQSIFFLKVAMTACNRILSIYINIIQLIYFRFQKLNILFFSCDI